MLSGVYRPRWEHFFEVTRKAIEDPDFEYDRDTFRQQVRDMDWEWIHQTQPYPAEPQGDPVEAVQAAFAKYHDLIEQRYREARFEVQLENAQFREIGF
jgi:hypothetical protein